MARKGNKSIYPDEFEKIWNENGSACGVSRKEAGYKVWLRFQKRIDKLKGMVSHQGKDGNWNYNVYMHGLYNGMEFALAIIQNREPEYKDTPKEFLSEKSSSETPVPLVELSNVKIN